MVAEARAEAIALFTLGHQELQHGAQRSAANPSSPFNLSLLKNKFGNKKQPMDFAQRSFSFCSFGLPGTSERGTS